MINDHSFERDVEGNVVLMLFRLLPGGTKYNREKSSDNRRPSGQNLNSRPPNPTLSRKHRGTYGSH